MEIQTIDGLKNIMDRSRVRLHPNGTNPLHKSPVDATFSGGYFMCDGSDPMDGPDYYWRDVFQYNERLETLDT